MADVGSGRGLVIAAPASSSGKTLVTLGLLAALRSTGRAVGAAKVGPDYIDPRFHEAASGRTSQTLDPWAMSPDRLRALAGQAAHGTDLLVVEGVMGLFDGPEAGRGSTADLARTLGLPVVLVVDARRQGASIAALVRGFRDYDPSVKVAGVIANRVGSPKHERLVRSALDPIGVVCFGCIPKDDALALPSRHLGLVQAGECPDLGGFMRSAAALIAGQVDLDRLVASAGVVPEGIPARDGLPPLGQRLAVAQDAAFGFSYPHLLDDWRRLGAEIHPFSPLADEPPDAAADAVFLPGGYPELWAGQIAAAGEFLDGLRSAATRGALIYGECGGYMTLGRGLVDAEGVGHRMAGLLPVDTRFDRRALSLGYRRLSLRAPLPWPSRLAGHEFHYATLGSPETGEPVFDCTDSTGTPLGPAGLSLGRVAGSFIHVIDCGT